MGRQVYSESLTVITISPVASDQQLSQYLVVDALGVAETTAGAGGIGILQNRPDINETAKVGIVGVSKAIAGAAIVAGVQVTNDASGKVVTATATDIPIGWALQAAGAADELLSVLVVPSSGQLNV